MNLTPAEACERLRCSKGQLSKIINGKIKGVPPLKHLRLGRRVLIREEVFESWMGEVEKCSAGR